MKGKYMRLLALLMSLAMVFSLFPIGVLAVEGEEEIPEEEIPVEEVPVEETPVEEIPAQEAPVEEVPEEEEETPVEEVPEEEETPVEEVPEEEEAPVEEIPEEEETPVEEIPEEEETPVEEIPEEEETPVEEIPEEEETPVEEIPEEEVTPVEEIPEEEETPVIEEEPTEELTETNVVDSGFYGENISWELTTDGVLNVNGMGAMPAYPSWNNRKDSILSVVISYGVTAIGEAAFDGCASLSSVTIPDSVTSIGNGAFVGCSCLSSLTIPSSVFSIGVSAFEGSGLASVTIPSGVTAIAESTFYNCSSLQSVTIPNGVTTIGGGAFAGCSSLPSVTIPGSVTSIGASAFEDSGLNSIEFLGNMPQIGQNAFLNVTASVKYPTGNASYTAENMLDYGGALTWLIDSGSCGQNLSWELTDEGVLTVSGTGPMTNGTWKKRLFNRRAASISSVVITPGVTTVGDYAFYECRNMESVSIPDSVTYIGDSAFTYCEALPSVTLTDNVTYIGEDAFHRCSSLESFTTPKYVTAIYGGTFLDCSSLKSVNIPDGVTYIGYMAFTGCPITSITIPDSVTFVYEGAFSGCYALESVSIPSSLTSIEHSMFRYCSSLKSVNIPESVTSIGGLAFRDCTALTSITIPASVTSIGADAFKDCPALTSVTFLGDMPEIEHNSFQNDKINVHYPVDNPTYTAETMLNYGGTLKWDVYVTAQPTDATLKPGSKATFTVAAVGKNLSYQWQYRKSADRSWTNTTAAGYDTPSLTVSATAAKSGYQYRCKITGGKVTVYSDPATMNVWGITAQPKDKTAKPGSSAVFSVETVGSGVTYQWQYRTSPDGSWKSTSATGSKTATLTLPATAGRNGYQYRCKVSCNGKNAYSDPATLTVWGFSAQPKDKTVKAGGTASFTVEAVGANLSYQWQYRKSASGSWTNTSATGCKTDTLTLPATVGRNGYQYRCKISSDGKNAYSDVVTLTVWGFSAQPRNVSAKAGGTATFTVKAQGENLTYQWQYRKTADGSWTNTTATGCKTATLSIGVTKAKDGYQYRCKITCGSSAICSDPATLSVQ